MGEIRGSKSRRALMTLPEIMSDSFHDAKDSNVRANLPKLVLLLVSEMDERRRRGPELDTFAIWDFILVGKAAGNDLDHLSGLLDLWCLEDSLKTNRVIELIFGRCLEIKACLPISGGSTFFSY